MQRRKIAIMVAAASILLALSASFVLLVALDPYNVRPITAGAEQLSITAEDLSGDWRLNTTSSHSYQNTTHFGGRGWNWALEYRFVNVMEERTWNLWVLISSYNSSGLVHEQYEGWMDSAGGPSYPLDSGEEGFFCHISSDMSPSGARVLYVFRDGNVEVIAEIDADGEDILNIEPWMTETISMLERKVDMLR